MTEAGGNGERITSEQRHTIEHPCGICGGHDRLPHEKDGRCFGFTAGTYIHCTQTAYRGQLERIETSGTFGHWTGGACKCGLPHDKTLRTPRQGNGHPVERKLLREIRYKLCNAAGEWIATHIRREYENAPKDFSWILSDQNSEGLFGKRKESLPLYRSDLLASLPPDALVIVTEGEKKCDALIEHDYLSVATVTGASGEIPCDESLAILKGRSVYLWPDNDEIGQKHMDRVAERLKKLGVTVKVISWSDAGEKEDAADFFRKGGTKEQLAHLLDHAEEWQPPEMFPPPKNAVPFCSEEILPLEYVIRPLASCGNLTMLQGDPKGGKSCFALYCAITAAVGIWPSGRFSIPRPRRVLFVTYEDGALRIQRRLKQYLCGLSCSPPPTLDIYTHQDAPFLRLEQADGPIRLRWMIERGRYDFVVLDTLSHLHGAEENSKKEIQPVMDALKNIARDCRCAIMAIHHTGKRKEDKSKVYRGRGSSAIAAAPDIIIDWGDRGETNTTPCIMMSKDDDQKPWNVVYSESSDKSSVSWSIEDQDAGSGYDSIRSKIISAIDKIALTSPEGSTRALLADCTGVPYGTLRPVLKAMIADESLEVVNGKNRQKFYRIKSAKSSLQTSADLANKGKDQVC